MTLSTHRTSITTRLARLPAFPTLRGARVRLRGPRTDDAEALFALFSDPAVMRYWSRVPMAARGEADGWIAERHDAFAQRNMLDWVSVDEFDRVIGTCALFRFDPRQRRAELGYALRSDLWGQGYAGEAVALVLDWGFRTLGLHRIEADIDARNAASRALLLRLGFARVELLRPRFFVGEVVSESEVFGLLAEDWRGGQR
jgi:ribosomal-protein-alanine N-acetyltransferase